MQCVPYDFLLRFDVIDSLVGHFAGRAATVHCDGCDPLRAVHLIEVTIGREILWEYNVLGEYSKLVGVHYEACTRSLVIPITWAHLTIAVST